MSHSHVCMKFVFTDRPKGSTFLESYTIWFNIGGHSRKVWKETKNEEKDTTIDKIGELLYCFEKRAKESEKLEGWENYAKIIQRMRENE